MRFSKATLTALCLITGMAALTPARHGWAAADYTAPSPQKSSPQSTAPTIQVYSRETVVDVTVTDAQGRPVHGLTKSDFILKEDGKPQPLRSFQEFGKDAPALRHATAPKLPPNVYTNLQPPPVGDAINIILLDFVNTAPDCDFVCSAEVLTVNPSFEMQHLMKQEVKKYLQTMPAGTQVAMIGLSPGNLRTLQGVTSDPDLLSAAVDTMQPVTSPIGGKGASTLDALNQIAAIASTIKGKKNLIWFTYGLLGMSASQKVAMAMNNLATAQVTIYPIGARGVYGTRNTLNTAAQALSLEGIAEAGGGTAYHDSNDLKTGIAKAIESGSSYYTLSYVPPGTQYDGRHHTINVKLATERPGLHLTYRNYYYAEDPTKMLPKPHLSLIATPPAAGAAADVGAFMSRGMPTSTQILFDAKVEPSAEPPNPSDPPIMGILDIKLKGKPLVRYNILYALPVSQIGFTVAPDGMHNGSVEFDLAAYDAYGKLISSRSQTMTLPLAQEEYFQFTKNPFQFFQQLDLPPGPAFLRIGIRDGVSNKVGTLEIPLTVPRNPPQQATTHPASTRPSAPR